MVLNTEQQQKLLALSSTRVMLVTGASGGIGKHIVLAAYKHNFCKKFVLVARRQEELERVERSLPEAECLLVRADVTVESEVQEAAQKALQRFGRVDIWVNNAGRGSTLVPSQMTAEDIDEMINVNVKSVLYNMKAALHLFKTNPAQCEEEFVGQIVNVSSLLGRAMQIDATKNTSYRAAYGPSKAFVSGMTDAFRMEINFDDTWRGRIAICAVNPGPVVTDFGVNANGPASAGQSVESCAEAIYQQTLLEQRDEMYSEPTYLPAVKAYLDRLCEGSA